MKRIALCIEYDGTHFCGWQTQVSQRTVQSELEVAVSKVAAQPISVVTAGRTDSAVHATGQIVHFDTTADRNLDAWRFGINRFLPVDIRVHWVQFVDTEFHARFSALSRTYRYIFYNSKVKPAILRNYATYYYADLDLKLMQQGAKHLLGRKDFSTIRAAGCQAKTSIREIYSLQVSQQREWLWFDVKANAFLQHMVRNIAGLLIDIGIKKYSPEWIAEVIAKQDRTEGGVTALPNGLYLTNVEYDTSFELPDSPAKPAYWS